MTVCDAAVRSCTPRIVLSKTPGNVLRLDRLTMLFACTAFFNALLRGTWSHLDHLLAGPPFLLLAMLSGEIYPLARRHPCDFT